MWLNCAMTEKKHQIITTDPEEIRHPSNHFNQNHKPHDGTRLETKASVTI